MPKIWTVWDNWNMKELGAFRFEEQALKAKMEFLEAQDPDDEFVNDDVLIEAFTLYE